MGVQIADARVVQQRAGPLARGFVDGRNANDLIPLLELGRRTKDSLVKRRIEAAGFSPHVGEDVFTRLHLRQRNAPTAGSASANLRRSTPSANPIAPPANADRNSLRRIVIISSDERSSTTPPDTPPRDLHLACHSGGQVATFQVGNMRKRS